MIVGLLLKSVLVTSSCFFWYCTWKCTSAHIDKCGFCPMLFGDALLNFALLTVAI
jgi:hypothetical protein